MPPPELTRKPHPTVVIEIVGRDNYNEVIRGEPREIYARWIWGQKDATNAQGDSIVLDAQVIVNEYIAAGSLLWQGELDKWYGTGSSLAQVQIMEVQTYKGTPDIKGRFTQHSLGVTFFRHKLPPTQ